MKAKLREALEVTENELPNRPRDAVAVLDLMDDLATWSDRLTPRERRLFVQAMERVSFISISSYSPNDWREITAALRSRFGRASGRADIG